MPLDLVTALLTIGAFVGGQVVIAVIQEVRTTREADRQRAIREEERHDRWHADQQRSVTAILTELRALMRAIGDADLRPAAVSAFHDAVHAGELILPTKLLPHLATLVQAVDDAFDAHWDIEHWYQEQEDADEVEGVGIDPDLLNPAIAADDAVMNARAQVLDAAREHFKL